MKCHARVHTDLGAGLWQESWPSWGGWSERWWGSFSFRPGADQEELCRGDSVTVQMFLVDRNISNGGWRRADVFFLLVSAVCVRRGGGTVVRIRLGHWPARSRGGGGGPWRGPGGNHRWGPRVWQGGHTRQRSAKPVFKVSKQLLSPFLNNLVELFSGGK